MMIVSACRVVPEYDVVPEIEFYTVKKIEKIYDNVFLSFKDSVIISIRFKDGDGDLGMDENDRRSNPGVYNYVLHVDRKRNGTYVRDSTYYEQFQLLSPKSATGPIDGILHNSKTFPYPFYFPNDTLRFSVTIYDRAGNRSNTVETPEVIIRKQ
ncbi:MAG: hypothetical protein NZ529_00250 [Cytophagaceae bacterium]|nr:hypothetical protein [Cytophagaceae bacterium]MDW8455195.1 hypothetical protein [Cytophagaceae bacterium]